MTNCKNIQVIEQTKVRIKQKFNLSDKEVDTAYDMALSDYLAIRFPSYNNRPSPERLNIDWFVSEWIYKRMVDIVGRAGLPMSGLKSYRENDLSFEFADGNIDPALVAEILPRAGVPK